MCTSFKTIKKKDLKSYKTYRARAIVSQININLLD